VSSSQAAFGILQFTNRSGFQHRARSRRFQRLGRDAVSFQERCRGSEAGPFHLLAPRAAEAEMLLITPKDGGRLHERPRVLINSLRARVETLFSKLWNGFVDRVLSRSWHGLWNTIKLKLLYYILLHAHLLSA
jgi:hypothetical protein